MSRSVRSTSRRASSRRRYNWIPTRRRRRRPLAPACAIVDAQPNCVAVAARPRVARKARRPMGTPLEMTKMAGHALADAKKPTPYLASTRMIVHLIDGTYELFRHFYGQRTFNQGKDKPFGAVAGVLHSVLEIVETGATHIGVATDHVIESFRNDLWSDYKTGEGIDPVLWAQCLPLEEALTAMGVAVWPMVELEADDALASAAQLATEDPRVEKVCIWTPDKDLAQCVREDRVVQVVRRGKQI